MDYYSNPSDLNDTACIKINKTLGKYNYLKNSKVYKKYIDNRYIDDTYINISIFTKDSLSSEEQKLFKNNDFLAIKIRHGRSCYKKNRPFKFDILVTKIGNWVQLNNIFEIKYGIPTIDIDSKILLNEFMRKYIESKNSFIN